MPVDVGVEQPENRPHIIRPKLFVVQAGIDKIERWRSAHRFGEMSPATLTSLLQESGEQGRLSKWGDFCEYMLETDIELASSLDTRVQRVVQAPYKFVPGKSPDPKAAQYSEGAARFCTEVIEAIPRWDEHMSAMVHALGPGVSAHELIWDLNMMRGAYTIIGFRWVHPHRLQFGEKWEIRLYDDGRKDGASYGQALRENGWFVHIAANPGTYAGKAGVLRYCAWPWLFKLWFRKFYAHAVETHGQPFVYGVVPRTAKDNVVEEMKSKLENLSYDTVAVFREGSEVIFNGGANVGDGSLFQNAIEMSNSAYDKLILGSTDISTPGVHGSQSAVDTRVEAALDPRTVADAKSFAASFKEQVLTPLCRLNFHLFGNHVPAIPDMVFGGDAEEDRMPEVNTPAPEVSPEQIEQAVSQQLQPQLTRDQQAALFDVVDRVRDGKMSRSAGVTYLTSIYTMEQQFAEQLLPDNTPAPPPEPAPPKAPAGPRRPAALRVRGTSARTTTPSVNPIKRALLGG